MKVVLKRILLIAVIAFPIAVSFGCGSLEKKSTVVEAVSEAENNVSPAQLEEYWYGFWYITDATEDWAPMEGYSWDCCGQLLVTSEGASLLLWDEDMPKDYYLAQVEFQQLEDGYCCTGGEFLDIELGRDLVSIKIREDEGRLLELSGAYSDGSTGSFYYVVCLRPWGELWPDGKSRPYYYERWYLPKIEAGLLPPDEIKPYQ